MRLGPGIGSIYLRGRRRGGMTEALKEKFLYLWSGKYDGDNLLSDLNDDVITVVNKDWETKYIPETTTGTFSTPDTAEYQNADTDNFWFALGVLQKTHTHLIESETERTFIKYSDFEPYNIYAIGILKAGEVLTESDKKALDRYFKLWLFYWGTFSDSGYLKDNRVID
jgi:hypothetical protein